MKRQYLAVLAILVALIALALWTSTQTNLHDIESRVTSAGNDSHEDNVGIIESMELLPYVVVTGVLLATGMAIFWFLGKRSAR